MNLNGILRGLKEGIKERKLFLEHQQTVAPNPRAHQVGRGLFRCPYINFKLQILIFKLHQILTISYFSKFYCSFEKNCLLQNIPKNHQKIYKTPQNIDLWSMSRGFLYCLKCKRDISIKPILSDVKTAFRCTPTLSAPILINVSAVSTLIIVVLKSVHTYPQQQLRTALTHPTSP